MQSSLTHCKPTTAQFLTFAATVLVVLANIGQLTNNIVARNIRFVSINALNIANAASSNNVPVPSGFLATDQNAPVAQGQGIKNYYSWGLYNYCAGEKSGSARSCVDSTFGYEWQPFDAILADTPDASRSALTNFIPDSTFRDSSYLADYTLPAFYLVFVGTVLTGLAFLIGFLAARFAFLFAALSAFLGALCLAVGAAIFTAVYVKTKDSIGTQYGITLEYGNALWFIWAAFAADALAIIPYIISCCTGRDKY